MTEAIDNRQSKIDNRIEFPPWYGEFGWEVASWVPFCRKKAAGYDQVVVTSFDGMGPLYADFATEFKTHGQPHRGLKYQKLYRPPPGGYYKYGRPDEPEFFFDCLIHARGIPRKNSINYRRWDELLGLMKKMPGTCAVIGSRQDDRVGDLFDMRGLELQKLMDLISRAKMVIGVSSGLMHLSAFCGTDLVVWGDRRTYFSETLEQRYKVTWNPFNVKVGWVDAEYFQPEPEAIAERIREIYESSTTKYTAAAGRSDDVHTGGERLQSCSSRHPCRYRLGRAGDVA